MSEPPSASRVEASVLSAAGTSAGAYIHIPFCAHRCTYCSFVALEGREGESRYLGTLPREIAARAGEVNGPLDTVYFGGGTPSYVEPGGLAAVVESLRDAFGVAAGAEVTVEGNPDDLDEARLEALQRLGTTRLSVGVQSLVDPELAWLERRHDAASALLAVRRAVGRLANVSADLMIGIPGQTRDSLRRSVDGLLGMGISHLSVYLLEMEKAPRLLALRTRQPELFPSDDEMADRWLLVDEMADSAGLPRYETSNWARPGRESRHNLKYWQLLPTLGFGVGAHSFDGERRRANTGATTEYVRRVERDGTAFVTEVLLSGVDLARERALLGLRLAAGIPAADLEAAVATLAPRDRGRLLDAGSAGLLESREGRVRLTREGVLVSNEVFSAFV